jgi:lipoprotein-releasing system ATP-binding protein
MLVVSNLSKSCPTPQGALEILRNVDLSLDRGQAAVITGPSGTGKSTLLYAIGALDPPTSGTVMLEDVNPYALADRELSAFRNRKIGFVFQDHCLLPQCSVIENVLTPTLVANNNNGTVERARSLLDQVGLGHRLEHRPAHLSGGEKQRVAIARALINAPALVLCDEPTGNLDHDSAGSVSDLLIDMHNRLKTILVVVTHSREVADRFEIRFRMNDGHLDRAR